MRSIGHACVLHACLSVHAPARFRGGHAMPVPTGNCFTNSARVCTPPPQRSLHTPQVPRPSSWQSSGHAGTAYFLDAMSEPQRLPPYSDMRSIWRCWNL